MLFELNAGFFRNAGPHLACCWEMCVFHAKVAGLSTVCVTVRFTFQVICRQANLGQMQISPLMSHSQTLDRDGLI